MSDDALAETVEGSEAPPSSPRRASSDTASPFDPPAAARRFIEAAELGRGGMGRVFEAVDTALDRQVAIKQSLADDPQLLARFEREVRITAKLQHPGIVPVLDAGRDAQGRPYYVMRRIEGKPLSEAIAQATTLERRLALVPNVLAAVDAAAYAHSRGVIHRDIKPWNVLVGPFGETLLIDWGLARELGSGPELVEADSLDGVRAQGPDELTRLGTAYGTPGFMPPEQARGETLDRRADVYALGATLYHTLTGSRPTMDATPTEALDLVARGQHRPELPETVPPELGAIVSKAMSTDRSRRYADAGALAEDLRRFTTGQLVAAHQYTARELVGRWIRRHRIALSITAVAMVVLAVVAAISIRNVMSARDAAAEAAAREAHRSDELVLEHANAVVTQDPTQAVALLRQLREDSPELWSRASTILDSAIARGVARGQWAHPGTLGVRLSTSPKGDAVVSISPRGAVLIHDPELRTPGRKIATIARAHTVEWVDHDTILVAAAEDRIHAISLAAGTTRIVATETRLLESFEGRAYALSRDSTLHQLDVGGGVDLPPVEDVTAALPVAGGVVYARGSSLVYDPERAEPVELVRLPTSSPLLARAADGRRFASRVGDEVIEWDLASGAPVERGRWSTPSQTLLYVADALLSMSQGRGAWLQPRFPPMHATAPTGSLSAHLAGTPCSFAATWTGALWHLCIGWHTQISGRSETFQSLALTSSHLIGATASGLLMSWRLAPLLGERVHLPIGMRTPVLFTGTRVFQVGPFLLALELGGKLEKSLGPSELYCVGVRHGVFSTLPSSEGETYVIDLHSMSTTSIGKRRSSAACSRQGRIALADGARIELRDPAAPAIVQRTFDAPFEIDTMHMDGDWLAFVGVEHQVVRIDLRTGAIATMTAGPVRMISVNAEGVVALARDTDAVFWQPDGHLATLPIANAVDLRVNPVGFVFIQRDKSLTVVDAQLRRRTHHHGSTFRPSVAALAPYATMPGLDGDLVLVDLRDGRTRQFPVEVRGAIIDLAGTRVFAWNGGSGMVWKIPPDRSREQVLETIDDITNAQLAPGDTRVSYP